MSAKAIKYNAQCISGLCNCLVRLLVAISTFPVSLSQSFVPPQEACLLINPCKHSGVPECGRDSKDLSTRLFRDDCDMVEHNCYNIQEYHKVDIDECNDKNSRISTNKYTTTVVSTTEHDNITGTTLLTTKKLQTTTAKPTKKTTTNKITISIQKKSALTSTTKSSKKPISTTRNLASTVSRSALTSHFKKNKSTTYLSTSQKSMINEPTTITSTSLDSTTVKSTSITCKSLTTSSITPTMASSTLPNIFVYIKNIYILRSSNTSFPNLVPTILHTPTTTTISPIDTTSTTSKTALSTIEIKNKSSSTKEKTTKTYSTKANQISTRKTEKNKITKSISYSTKRNYISSTGSPSPNVTETINETTTSPNNSSQTNCDGYPNDCKRPQTWETTAKGETRDFFQVLRDRFGNKVKYLDDTTHFPKRRVNTVDNFLQSFVLGDHNES